MNVAIEVADLRVIRGRRKVLDGLRLSIQAGRVTGLLGPSGSGKTTLMRCIVGVQRIAGGRVLVLGEPAGSHDLLLLRAGELIAATTPDELLARTGAADHDQAFLTLIQRDGRPGAGRESSR